jgi:hypothetical protein
MLEIEIGARLLALLLALVLAALIERWWHYAGRTPRR